MKYLIFRIDALDIRERGMYNKILWKNHDIDIDVLSATKEEWSKMSFDPRNLGCFSDTAPNINFIDKSQFNIDDYDMVEIVDGEIGRIKNIVERFLQKNKKIILKCWTQPSFEQSWKIWGNKINYWHTINMGNINSYISDWNPEYGIYISQAIEPDFFSYKEPRQVPEPLMIGYLGVLTWWKGHQYIEKIVADLADKNNNVQLLMFGRSSPQFGDEKPLNHKAVKYVGVLRDRNQVPKAFHLFDVFCDPWEPGPIINGSIAKNKPDSFRVACAEALMCGLPIIAFNCPAAREFVEHEKNGFLAENVEEMSDYIMRYYNNPKLIRQHSLYSREKAIKQLAPEVVINKMIEWLKWKLIQI